MRIRDLDTIITTNDYRVYQLIKRCNQLSLRDIARQSNVGILTVPKSITRLIEQGYIKRLNRAVHAHQATMYQIINDLTLSNVTVDSQNKRVIELHLKEAS